MQKQNSIRQTNIERRETAELLTQYNALNYATEVCFFHWMASSRDSDLQVLLDTTRRSQTLLKELQGRMPADKRDLTVLSHLASKKNQRLSNIIRQRQQGETVTLTESDRASNQAIANQIDLIHSEIDTRISRYSLLYDKQANLSRLLLLGIWAGAFVLAIAFINARRHWLSEQQRMIRYLAHDLDNLLTTVLSSAEILHRQELSVRAQKHSDRILRASHDLRNHLKELRMALAGDAIDLGLSIIEVNLVQLAGAALSSPAVLRHCNQHSFDFKTLGEPRLIRADSKLLERVLVNLLANAVKYSPGGGEVLVCVHFATPISIEVCDQGLGIGKEFQSKLFAPFQRGGNVGNIEGTGLGLAFVKEVASAHGWGIEVIGDARSVCSDKVYRTMFRLILVG